MSICLIVKVVWMLWFSDMVCQNLCSSRNQPGAAEMVKRCTPQRQANGGVEYQYIVNLCKSGSAWSCIQWCHRLESQSWHLRISILQWFQWCQLFSFTGHDQCQNLHQNYICTICARLLLFFAPPLEVENRSSNRVWSSITSHPRFEIWSEIHWQKDLVVPWNTVKTCHPSGHPILQLGFNRFNLKHQRHGML